MCSAYRSLNDETLVALSSAVMVVVSMMSMPVDPVMMARAQWRYLYPMQHALAHRWIEIPHRPLIEIDDSAMAVWHDVVDRQHQAFAFMLN